MQRRCRSGDPFFTINPIARVRRPIGTFTTQHSATPRAVKPDESPHGPGKAVDHTIKAPQINAALPKTSAAIWNRMAMPVGFFPPGGTKSGPELRTFAMLGNPSLAANVTRVAPREKPRVLAAYYLISPSCDGGSIHPHASSGRRIPLRPRQGAFFQLGTDTDCGHGVQFLPTVLFAESVERANWRRPRWLGVCDLLSCLKGSAFVGSEEGEHERKKPHPHHECNPFALGMAAIIPWRQG